MIVKKKIKKMWEQHFSSKTQSHGPYSCMLVSQSLCILLSRSDNRVCVNDFPNRALVNEPNRWQVETNVKE